ncbi:hypothetical protein A3D80_04755 [Candidatus Roizmanbacteria bacterium RIFCSPHIGHO2_02_FULL_40_13b]|nr:MAG: hypothetical protein A3D80_04755 [Candidatus Roizmanbacteria bacterium RIFCSPHIGHO2_02_FULL_40_13b]OGK50298.1 MAG: hypothetical protein A3A56_04405 [Candidatus Roizmanbacteria bacterium RIFCSPLOWO2_01_FULL_40_32]OGK56168.1 MAG: hypothetical protein A3H83_00225 [Candidatus Roizmanbacteria bacterium RIFCSPLOWO2_02_FULL_39_8]
MNEPTTDDGISPSVDETIKAQQVEAIVQADRQAFEEWVADPAHRMNLDMPHEALRYLLIPQRVLELAVDPSEVDIVIQGKIEQRKSVIVVDYSKTPLPDDESLRFYLSDDLKQKALSQSHKEVSETDIASLVTNVIILRTEENERLHVDQYFDREELRNIGVAKSFYGRLHTAATELGYRFITGFKLDEEVGFFTKKLGRVPLSAIKPELRYMFHPDPTRIKTNQFTIDFLDPADKEYFLDSGGE